MLRKHSSHRPLSGLWLALLGGAFVACSHPESADRASATTAATESEDGGPRRGDGAMAPPRDDGGQEQVDGSTVGVDAHCPAGSSGSPPNCVPTPCQMGFERDSSQQCVPCGPKGCNGTGGGGGQAGACDAQRVEACDALGRVCLESQQGTATCGPCHDGLVSQGMSCVAEETCGEAVCSAQEFCDILGEKPTCRRRPCPLGAAQAPDGKCASCTVASCAGVEGSTGRFWPFTSNPGECLCETKSGFFHNLGGVGLPIACDADGDGWTREEVRETQEQGTEMLRQNLRCNPASVTRVSLRDEYGIESHVWSCRGGLVQQVEQPECELLPLRLLESKRNDVSGELVKSRESVDANRADRYGKRDFRPEELNALTKACATAAADYNDDGTADIEEYQDVSPRGEQARLASFSHFIELQEASFEPPPPGEVHGRVIIRERSRCDVNDLRLRHHSGSDSMTGADAEYWRTCYRRRDAAFDLDRPAPGVDFAQWTLDPTGALCPDRGSCAALSPAHADIDSTQAGAATPFGHGVCSLGGRRPADGRFRGLNHHSQFKCVVLDDGENLRPQQRRPADFKITSSVDRSSSFNRCALGSCDPGAVDCNDGLRCEIVPSNSLAAGDVGFQVVSYQGQYDRATDGYHNGCVNEDVEWPELMCKPFLELLSSEDKGGFGLGGVFGKSTCDHWAIFGPEDEALVCDATVRTVPMFFAPDDGEACNASVFAP